MSCSRHPELKGRAGFPREVRQKEPACSQVPAPWVRQRSPMSRGGEMVYIPDDSDFSSFRDQCESLEGWHCRYNKAGVTVWSQGQEESCTVQKIKVSKCLQLRDCSPSLPQLHPRVPGVLAHPRGAQHPGPACLGVFLPQGSHCLPCAFSLSTCRDAAAAFCRARVWAHVAAALDPDTRGKAPGSITLQRWPCWEPPGMRQSSAMPPWCLSPSHTVLQHIPAIPHWRSILGCLRAPMCCLRMFVVCQGLDHRITE